MAHPKPFLIKTPPPSAEETAKRLGLSLSEFRRAMKLVDEVLEPISPRKRPQSSSKSSHRRAAAKPSRLSS